MAALLLLISAEMNFEQRKMTREDNKQGHR